MKEQDIRRNEIIDRCFGIFYGIGQLMPLSSLWDSKFDLPMQCLRFCLKNAGKTIRASENGNQNDSVANSIGFNHISSLSIQKEINDAQLGEIRFAFLFFTLLLCRLTTFDVKNFSEWRSIIDTLTHEAYICGLYDTDIIQWFRDELKKDNDTVDIARKYKNLSPLASLAGAIRLINTSRYWKYDSFGGIRQISDLFGLNNYGASHLLEPNLFLTMLGSIAGALIGRNTLASCYDGCALIGPHELHIAGEIGNMITTPGIVPEMNEGFFTNILIVSNNPDDETHDISTYLALKYPNASIYTLICQEEPTVLLEELSDKIVSNSIDLVIGIRSVASVVCQMRGTSKILIFPEFHNIWPSDDMDFHEELVFGGMTFKEQGLTYGIFTGLNDSKDDMDSSLYWKYYKSGERGYESGTVSSLLIDNLGYTIWNLCTPTVLPEYKPSPYR